MGDAERDLDRGARSGPSASRAQGATQFDWVKSAPTSSRRHVRHDHARRGVQLSRLGTFLERADNTARILDVKYRVILPSVDEVGGALDYLWAALLRSVSSLETYRALYRDQIFDQGGTSS